VWKSQSGLDRQKKTEKAERTERAERKRKKSVLKEDLSVFSVHNLTLTLSPS
jgi:hypothetical protein